MNRTQSTTNKESTLVNFISPNQILETFDDICSFQSTTRTSTLIKLMKEFIVEQSTSIPHQIQSIQNLKNGLSNFEVQKESDKSIRQYQTREFTGYKLRNNINEPISFFSDALSEDDL